MTATTNAIILIDVTEYPKSNDVFDIAGRVLPETAVVYFTAKTVGYETRHFVPFLQIVDLNKIAGTGKNSSLRFGKMNHSHYHLPTIFG